jgi:hypothetical protein
MDVIARVRLEGHAMFAAPAIEVTKRRALARVKAGALLSAATAASSVAASGWSAHAAWKASA